ncbi:hypothetical protein AHAS_Ahas01G0152000 [Arachis hypogaea]
MATTPLFLSNLKFHHHFLHPPPPLKLFTQWWLPLPPQLSPEPSPSFTDLLANPAGSSSSPPSTSPRPDSPPVPLTIRATAFPTASSPTSPNINSVIDDCIAFFDEFRSRFDPSLLFFLYSEFLGGAIALLITLRCHDLPENVSSRKLWNGLILNGAMCEISEKFKPPWPLEHFLSIAAAIILTWRVVPTCGSIPDVSFKVEWKRKLALASLWRKVARP